MNERRLGERHRKRLPARVINTAGCVTEVTVVDISSSGARLELRYGASLDKRHTLRIQPTLAGNGERQEFEAEVVWRNEFEAGIRFVAQDETTEVRRQKPMGSSTKVSLADLRTLGNIPRK